LRKWLKKDRIGVALAVALLTTAFYKLNVCDVKQKGREHRIWWFQTFLASGEKMSSETVGIGSNVPCLSALGDESYSLNLLSDNFDIELGGENALSSGE